MFGIQSTCIDHHDPQLEVAKELCSFEDRDHEQKDLKFFRQSMNDCLKKYCRWSVERFPVPAVLLYSGAQFYLAYSFGGLLPETGAPVFLETIVGWTILFLMLLRLRITDEQKDFVSDTRAYPDRTLSRGIICAGP